MDAFFRAGVGAVVTDDRRRILTLRRKGVADGTWQLPQGGVGYDEEPLAALYRELREETGLTASDVELVESTEEWWVYELPLQYRNRKVGWGQAQRWYLMRLRCPAANVHADQVEFSAVDWVTPQVLLARAVSFRVPVYRRVIAAFALDGLSS